MSAMELKENVFEDLKRRMDGAIHNFKNSLAGLRTGRAHTSLLEPIKVEAYGGISSIGQLGNISALDARTLVVQVWDGSLAKSVEKAIMAAGLGLNPIAEGHVIRVPLPDLSNERRKELVKKSSEYGESTKIAIRNIRRDAIDEFKKMEKQKEISENELKHKTDEIQKVVDQYVKKVDELRIEKEKDILET